MSAILSDTLNLKSPTCTRADKFAVCLLASLINLDDIDDYAGRMFKAKTEWVCSLGAKAMCRADAKEFEASGKQFAIAVLEIAGTADPVVKLKDEIRKELEVLRVEKNMDYSFLFVVDVVTQTSVLISRSAEETAISDLAFNLPQQGFMDVKPIGNYASRKKQLFPMLQTGLKQYLQKWT